MAPPTALQSFADELGAAIFRRLIEGAPDAMIVVDASGTMLFANAQTERLFGYPVGELEGQRIELLMPDRFRASHTASREKFAHTPKARPMGSGLELCGRKKDGQEFYVEVSLSPFQAGERKLVAASVRDVSERRKIRDAARRANQLLVNAVESFQGGFALFDAEDALVMCNSAYRELLGRPLPGEIVGRHPAELIDANLAAQVLDLQGEAPADFRARWSKYYEESLGSFDVKLMDGRTMRLMDRRTSDGGRVATVLDITADVQREAEVHAARALAERASSAKSEFLASMSHELRTPLNAILGFAQLLQRDKRTPLNERQQERLRYVLKGGEHLLHLIDEILDLSRIEAGRVAISLEPVGIREVLEEVVATLDPMATRSEIRLELDLSDAQQALRVIADRTRFVQILMNYGSNAIKYGRKDGTVRFVIQARGSTARISVHDDGIGIPLDKQQKIFEPFQRAGQETGPIEGTGIGLTISKRLANVMGGSVGFSSTPEGSEFWLDLPLHAAAEASLSDVTSAARVSGMARPNTAGNRPVILYIEDNPSNVSLMEEFLTDYGRAALITAHTAEIGIEIARARPPALILMDVNLPGMSGLEASRRLREWPETREIPIVGLSAAAMIRDAKRVKEAGFVKYLTKPVNVDELAAVLDELLAKSTALAEEP